MKDNKRLTTEIFLERARCVHGDIYDYSKVRYRNSHTKVCIICKEHGEFHQYAYSHLQGHGCPECAKEKDSKRRTLSKSQFVLKAKEVHADVYDYQKTIYKKSYLKVCVTCKKHGDFLIRPNSHLMGCGCPKCWEEKRGKAKIRARKDVLTECASIHNNKYDYSLITDDVYIDTHHKVPIICHLHGIFFQTIHTHRGGVGCPHCPPSTISVGEDMVNTFLSNNGIEFIPQYRFLNDNMICKNKTFVVDFYLPKYNTVIEYNGQQHYKEMGYFGGKEKLEQTQDRDLSFRVYCKEHKLKLIEIPFTKRDEIGDIISKALNLND